MSGKRSPKNVSPEGKGLGVKLSSARKQRNISLQMLGEAISVSPSYLSKVEKGITNDVSGFYLVRIAGYFGWTIGELQECYLSVEEEEANRQIKQLEQELVELPQVQQFIEASRPLLIGDASFSRKKLYLTFLQSFPRSNQTA